MCGVPAELVQWSGSVPGDVPDRPHHAGHRSARHRAGTESTNVSVLFDSSHSHRARADWMGGVCFNELTSSLTQNIETCAGNTPLVTGSSSTPCFSLCYITDLNVIVWLQMSTHEY